MSSRTDAPTPGGAAGAVLIVTPDIVGPVKNGGIGTACFHYARSLANAGHEIGILFSGEIGDQATAQWARWYAELGIGFHTLDETPPSGGGRRAVFGTRWHDNRAHRIFEFLRQRDDDYILFQDWHAKGFWAERAKRMGVAFARTRLGVILDNYPLTVIERVTNGFCFLASDAGGIPEMIDPAVRFERTVTGLRQKLEELPSIDFGGLRHLYDPAEARRVWLRHVAETVEGTRRSSIVRVARSPVPPVSVCIPFYRHDHYLDRPVHAFLRMNLSDLQLVFVNDGTPREQCPRFEALARELEPLGHVFHHQVNAGPGSARNRATQLARHDLLLFFDADNVPFPNLVERLTTAMTSGGADCIAAPFAGVPPMIESAGPGRCQHGVPPPPAGRTGSSSSVLWASAFDTRCIPNPSSATPWTSE